MQELFSIFQARVKCKRGQGQSEVFLEDARDQSGSRRRVWLEVFGTATLGLRRSPARYSERAAGAMYLLVTLSFRESRSWQIRGETKPLIDVIASNSHDLRYEADKMRWSGGVRNNLSGSGRLTTGGVPGTRGGLLRRRDFQDLKMSKSPAVALFFSAAQNRHRCHTRSCPFGLRLPRKSDIVTSRITLKNDIK